MNKDLLYNIALSLIKGVGPLNEKKLLEHFGSAEEIFRTTKRGLMMVKDIGEVLSSNITTQIQSCEVLRRAEEELTFIEKNKIDVYLYNDEKYPRRLKHCADAPILLYTKGSINFNCSKILGMVGTRKSTDYGKRITTDIIEAFVGEDILIVSGLAYGIDTISHKVAVETGLPTVGVLGHGLDRIYPTQNRSLAVSMLENGGLATEFISKTNPDAVNFPARNRIIAGLCDAIVVVEAATTGGALITADIANSYNRDVFAVPGKIGDDYSKGCNGLIKSNRANLIQSADDIRYILNWNNSPIVKQKQRELCIDLTEKQQKIYSIIENAGNIYIDDLCTICNEPLSWVSTILLQLEIKDIIESLPGKCYKIR
jgi:DNA processing protein